MATLLQSIKEFIDKITVTDRQEENITSSVNNLTTHLLDKDNNLAVEEVFTTGSWERDTIIRPLNDVDLFAVLKRKEWEDEYGQLPTPQSVLTKLKNFLNGLNDYKDKVKQDRPCVTIVLSDKNFDVMPAFEDGFGGYYIPNHDLSGWIHSSPKQLEKDLNAINKNRSFNVKSTIKAVKSWNRDISKLIPSYHIEEVAISIFQMNNFSNFEQSIRLWFDQAEYYLSSSKFKSQSDYDVALKKVKKVKEKLNDAKKLLDDKKESEAKEIWKDIFGKEFSITDEEEAKNFSKSFSEGALKVSSTGLLSTQVGKSVPPSTGVYGDN